MKQEEKLKALDAALVKIEKDYGKGSVMKLGEYQADRTIEQGRRLSSDPRARPVHRGRDPDPHRGESCTGELVGLAGQTIAAALAAQALEEAVLHQNLEDVFEVFFGDLLPGGDLFQRDIFFRAVLSQIYHHTQRIAPLGGNDHRHSFLFFPVIIVMQPGQLRNTLPFILTYYITGFITFQSEIFDFPLTTAPKEAIIQQNPQTTLV